MGSYLRKSLYLYQISSIRKDKIINDIDYYPFTKEKVFLSLCVLLLNKLEIY